MSALSGDATAAWELGVVEANDLIAKRELSPVELVSAVIDRSAQLDESVRAWATLDGERALHAARRLEQELGRASGTPVLAGATLGIKDVLHVQGMPTTAGSRAYYEMPERDAACVADLRRAGGSILGKLYTAEFASKGHPPTRNPWNLEHTPGGSSSGSAAAVAVGMVNAALGTQTAGSTLRPAAYCGVVGFKPTYGLISCDGVVPLAWSLDHVGIFARSVDDVAAVLDVLGAPQSPWLPGAGGPRLGVPIGYFRDRASASAWRSYERTLAQLEDGGATLVEIFLPPEVERAAGDIPVILKSEMAAFHADRFPEHRSLYGPGVADLIVAGLEAPAHEYITAMRRRPRLTAAVERAVDAVDALVTPSTPTEAPPGLESTGDASFQVPWSYAGLPAISIPADLSEGGLPLGLQLVARRDADRGLLQVARWCATAIGFTHRPPTWR